MSEVAIKVAVRVRPFSRREMEQNQKNIIRVLDDTTLVFDPDEDEDEFFFHGAKQTHRDITKRIKKKLNMEFDSVLRDEATNDQVFEVCTKPIVTSVMNGFNCSVFVYGATGAGKTFTMLGSENNPGITFLTMRELFSQIEILSDERKFDIGISYLEVYNEQVMNLLTKSGPLKLQEDSNGVVVGGLVLKQIHNADELFDLLILGNKNRTQHPTDANEESSRSHAIFQVHIRMTNKKTSVRRTVKLSMIDLAGSERAQSTKCKGLRFKEGANINKSLLALGNCINKLADGCKHIPYRDSNLTRILKDSLGGNCQTLMIANISPSSLTYEDTYNTLKYASRAKKIRTTVRANVVSTSMPKEFLLKKCNENASEIEKLKAENEKLKERNKMMESQLTDQKSSTQSTNVGDNYDMKGRDLTEWYERIDSAYNSFKKSHEKCLSLQSNEKILSFRIKFKERYEAATKVLTLDGSRLKNDLSKLEASIDKYSKEVHRIKTEESSKWAKRFKEANYSIESLKQEIADKNLNTALEIYLQKKNGDLEISKLLMKTAHVNKINNVYQTEIENLSKIVLKASEIIQQNFLLLRSTDMLDKEMLENLQILGKLLHGQRNVKFADDEHLDTETANILNEISPDAPEGINMHIMMDLTDCLEGDGIMPSPPSNKKRSNDEVDDAYELENGTKKIKSLSALGEFPFLRPKALKSIKFDQPTSKTSIASEMNTDMNVTFDLAGTAVSKVLKETSNKDSIISLSSLSKSVSKPSKQFKSNGSLKLALNINKENKKYSPGSNRVKKLARTPSRVAGSKDHRPKLVKSAVASSLVVMPAKDKLKTFKTK